MSQATARRVLIVEDETVVQLHLRRIVEELGHEVVGTATTGEEALEIAADRPPELALLDVQLPGDLDGIETARALRARQPLALVFVTAYADDDTVGRITQVGASGYVVKPFSPAEIRAVLATALQGHERMQAMQEQARSLSSILGSVGNAVIVTDAAGRVTHWTPRATEITGWEENAALGQPLADVVAIVGEADAKLFAGAVAQAQRSGEGDVLPEFELQPRQGQSRAVRAEIEALPAEGPDGGPARGVVVMLQDVARRWRARAGVNAAAGGNDGRRRASGKRVLLYSHDTFGLGHLQRTLNLTRAILRHTPGASVLLATGSPVAHRYRLPAGADYVKLPAVKKVASERYEARSLEVADHEILKLRTNLLLRTVRDFEPDVLLVDHAPRGMRGEMLPSLEWLQRNSHCVRMLGLRDIIDDPQQVIRSWRKQGIYDVLRDLYDRLVVYGSRDVFDLAGAYAFPPELQQKTRYVHYVVQVEDERPDARDVDETFFAGLPRPLVVVTIGGGDGAGETVIGNYLKMLRQYRDQVDFHSVLLPGPLLPDDLAQRFAAEAEGLPVTLRDFVPTTQPYLRHADLVVCTAGYNTMIQTLAHAPRALVIPRVMYRQEQRLRAQLLADRGWVQMLSPEAVTPDTLFQEVRRQLDDPRQPLTEARTAHALRFDGAQRLAAYVGKILASQSQMQGAVRP